MAKLEAQQRDLMGHYATDPQAAGEYRRTQGRIMQLRQRIEEARKA
jgi:hypothetical protein